MQSVRLPALLLTVAGLALASGLHAQSDTPAPAPAVKEDTTQRPAILQANPAASTTPAPSNRARAISPELSAQLLASAPKYDPAKRQEAEAKRQEAEAKKKEMVDMREVDKPRNGIVRLDPYVVTEPRERVLSERAINTQKGLRDLAYQRYIGEFDRALSRVTVPFFGYSAQDRALAMYGEDERLKNMSDLNDTANTVSKADPAAGEYVRRETQKAYMRTSDFGWSNGNSASQSWVSEAGSAIRNAGNAPGERK